MKPNKQPRRVQQMMIDAQRIADGDNPHVSYGPVREAPNKQSLKAGILANQPETRKEGLDRIREWYEQGGYLWCTPGGNECLSPSHEHNLLAGQALHLRAALVPNVVDDVLAMAIKAWRLWTAAVAPCGFYEEQTKGAGRGTGKKNKRERVVSEFTLQHAGVRGKDISKGQLVIEAENECADKCADALLNNNWRKASYQFDVALPLLDQSMVSMLRHSVVANAKEFREKLIGGDYGLLTDELGYEVLTGDYGHYSYFGNINWRPGGMQIMYGAGWVNGERVLHFDESEAIDYARSLNG